MNRLLRRFWLAFLLLAAGVCQAAPFAYVNTPEGIRVFDVATHQRVTTIPLTGNVAARPGLNRVFVLGTPIQVIDTGSHAVIGTLPAENPVHMALSPVDTKAVILERVLCPDSYCPTRVRLVDTASGAELGRYTTSPTVVIDAIFNSDGTRVLVSSSLSSGVWIFRTDAFGEPGGVFVPFAWNLGAHPSPNRFFVGVGAGPWGMREYDMDTGAYTVVPTNGLDGIPVMSLDVRNRLLVSFGYPLGGGIREYMPSTSTWGTSYPTSWTEDYKAMATTPGGGYIYGLRASSMDIFSTRLGFLRSFPMAPTQRGPFIGGPIPALQPLMKSIAGVTLTTSRYQGVENEPIVLTATVAGPAGVATGNIDFHDGSGALLQCRGITLVNGAAQCSVVLSPGTHALTAAYSGDGQYEPLTSVEVFQTVLHASSTSLASSANPAAFNTAITFTAAVSSNVSPVPGTVTFRNGGTPIAGCSAVSLSASVARCTVPWLPSGAHTITAEYSGSNVRASSTGTLVQVVTAPPSGAVMNVAAATAGSTATASSSYSTLTPASSVIDGRRTGAGFMNGDGWMDATFGQYPDWVEIRFGGVSVIDRVVVYTLADAYGSEPTDSTSAAVYGLQNFTVEGWTGSAWQVLGTVTGNTLAKRTVTLGAFTTDRIRINVTAAAYYMSRILEVEAWGIGLGPAPAPAPANVALASAGAVATASSIAAGYPVASVIDGVRSGLNWGTNGGWQDNTFNAYPDWVQVQFNGQKSIDRVVVYTLSDTYGTEPTDATTATTYGVKNFTVEGWNGSAWQVLATVTGNALAKRIVPFTPFTTDRIRINVSFAAYYMSRIVEIEAWTTGTGPAPVPTNVALGAMAMASTVAAGYPVGSVTDGVRSGLNWGSNGGWQDNTFNAYPDFVDVLFPGEPKTIDRVVVYTLSDTYGTEPTAATTAINYGVKDFTVQAMVGGSWQVLGTVTGNTLAKRTVTFAPVTTTAIRVHVTAAAYYMSRIVEIEAWGN